MIRDETAICFVEISGNAYFEKPHACPGIFETLYPGIVLCQVPYLKDFLGLKVESPVYDKFLKSACCLVTCNLLGRVCGGDQNLGGMRALLLAGCRIQNILLPASTCLLAKISALLTNHDGSIQDTVWALTCQYFTCPLRQCSSTFSFQCLPKMVVLCSVTGA